MLRIAFERRLIFTVGTSVTTGRSNVVVWNNVHHKTNTSGGSSYFGYPDVSYFNRVKMELASNGITTSDITGEDEEIRTKILGG
jgi:deltex-like protein